MYVRSSFKHLCTLAIFAAVIVLFGFLAPSLMGLALLALLVVVPVAILGAVGWLLWKSALAMRKPTPASEQEAKQ